MLQFKIDSTSENIILTLTELVDVDNPIYLFRLQHVMTKELLYYTLTPDDDLSNYPNRYNKFNINPSWWFAGSTIGEWIYEVYQGNNGKFLESGKLLLERASDFEFTKYNNATTFRTYNG